MRGMGPIFAGPRPVSRKFQGRTLERLRAISNPPRHDVSPGLRPASRRHSPRAMKSNCPAEQLRRNTRETGNRSKPIPPGPASKKDGPSDVSFCIDGSIHGSFTRTRNPVPEGGLQSIDDKPVRCCRSCPESEDIHLPPFCDGRGDQHHHLPLLP